MRMETLIPSFFTSTRTASPRKMFCKNPYWRYSSVSAQLMKSTFSVTVGRSQPLSNSACAALRISS